MDFKRLNSLLAQNSDATERALAEFFVGKNDNGSLKIILEAQK